MQSAVYTVHVLTDWNHSAGTVLHTKHQASMSFNEPQWFQYSVLPRTVIYDFSQSQAGSKLLHSVEM